MRTHLSTALLVSSLLAGPSWASGFYLGENGATSLLQGGAFTAQSDDLTAIDFNPAGLAQWSGFRFALDNQLINHDARFQREDANFDPANPPTLANEVSNTGGLFYLPFIGAGYGTQLAGRRFTFALGLYGPPSVGRYQFSSPDYRHCGDQAKSWQDVVALAGCGPTATNYLHSPRKFAPQRYELVKNDIIILYPTLSLGVEVVPKRVFVGASLQYVYSTFSFEQVLYSGLVTPPNQGQEDPIFDSTVKLSLTGKPQVTGILGVLVRPLDWLQVGASVRPPIGIEAEGKLNFELGEAATALGTQVTSGKSCGTTKDPASCAKLNISLPLEVRAGVYARPIPRLGVNVDFVYQGWQSVHELLLTPEDVSLKIGSGTPTAVSAFHIPKNWHHTISVRAGGSFDVMKYLTVHAGFWWESAAADDNYATIDFMHFDRVFITGGVTVHLGPLDVVGGVAVTPTVTKYILASDARAGSTDATVEGGVVGYGVYNSGGYVATLGLRGHFGDAPPASEPSPPAPSPPAPSPAPAPAPSPAPAAAPN